MPYLYPASIFEAVRRERKDFLNSQIEIVPGYLFSQYETVKRSHLYYNSRFESGEFEKINNQLRKKIFFNINKWRCDVATKMLDIDTKDFRLIPEDYNTEWIVYLLERRLKDWLTTHELGIVLNEVTRKLPVYGTVVLEKTRDGVEVTDLRYFMNDQSAKSLDTASYIIKKDLMTPSMLRKMSGVWDNVDIAIERYCKFTGKSYEDSEGFNKAEGTPDAEIYTRYAEVPLTWFTEKESDMNTYVRAKYVVAGVDDTLKGEDGKQVVGENGLVLWKEKIKELPFREVHYQKTEGRWLGIGVVEDTFQPQERMNEVKNQQGKSLELSGKHVYHSPDRLKGANVLTDVEDGSVIRSKSGITALDTVNRNWSAFQAEVNDYEKLADRLTFSYDIVRGEATPASATATAVSEQLNQASSIFDYKRENIGLFLGGFIKTLVFPEFINDIGELHSFRVSGSLDDIEKTRMLVAKAVLRQEIWEKMLINGRVMTQQERGARLQELQDNFRTVKESLWLKVVREFFQNLNYHLTLEITGEAKNVYAQLQNAQSMLTLLVRNPDVLRNPLIKKVMFKFMSAIGMSLTELEEVESELTDFQSVNPTEVAQKIEGTTPAKRGRPSLQEAGQARASLQRQMSLV